MRQGTFSDLGTPLHEVCFVALDLETTGGSRVDDNITEVGAIKSRGGETLGTFDTLVRPSEPIPASISLLTGITDQMVASAPPIEEVLPNLYGFLEGSVVVAHNASFDAGFLRAAFTRHGYEVPFKTAVCTVRMGRRLMRGESRDMRLATLARALGTPTEPTHRALPDAKAAHEVFLKMLELAGPLGVVTLEDLRSFIRVGSKPKTSKLPMVSRIPRTLGVYRFLDARGQTLYVGKAKNLRSRVRSYFYGDPRPGIAGLTDLVAKVDVQKAPTPLWAAVTEQRLIAKEQPRFNRRGKRRGKEHWITLKPATSRSIARIAIARTPSKGQLLLGPFSGRKRATAALDAIRAALPIPRCSDPRRFPGGCAFGEMGHCLAPCQSSGKAATASLLKALSDDMASGAALTLGALYERMGAYSETQRFEEAAAVRDHIEVLEKAVTDRQICDHLRRAGQVVAWVPSDGGFDVAVIDSGKLVDACNVSSVDEIPTARRLLDEETSEWLTLDELAEMRLVGRFIDESQQTGGVLAPQNLEKYSSAKIA